MKYTYAYKYFLALRKNEIYPLQPHGWTLKALY